MQVHPSKSNEFLILTYILNQISEIKWTNIKSHLVLVRLCCLGLVLVTDAITAMGLPPGLHTLGQQVIEIQGLHAYVAGLFFFFF